MQFVPILHGVTAFPGWDKPQVSRTSIQVHTCSSCTGTGVGTCCFCSCRPIRRWLGHSAAPCRMLKLMIFKCCQSNGYCALSGQVGLAVMLLDRRVLGPNVGPPPQFQPLTPSSTPTSAPLKYFGPQPAYPNCSHC